MLGIIWPNLQVGVGSVTVHGSIYKLRRTDEMISGGQDFTWLAEIGKISHLSWCQDPNSTGSSPPMFWSKPGWR
jgi:hypothetical protein